MDAKETVEKPIKRGKGGLFLEGTRAGPGRTVGSKSIKDAVRQYLVDHPEEFKDFVTYFIKENRELTWQMVEGRPHQGIGQAPELGSLAPNIIVFSATDPLALEIEQMKALESPHEHDAAQLAS